MDWLKCNICFNTYNDSNLRPRVLNCGHSFCERCLNNTIQNNTLTCPQCRKVHEINSASELPIIFALEGLLKSITPCLQDVSEGAISGPIEAQCDGNGKSGNSLKLDLEQEKSLSSQKELLKTSAGICYEHPCNELKFRCSLHKSWVCERCIEEMGDHPKHSCTITSFKEEMENRRQEYNISLDKEEKSFDETILIIEKHISYLSEKREHHGSLFEILQGLENIHRNEVKNLQSEIESFEKIVENGKLEKQSLLNIKAVILKAETLDESIAVRDIVENKKLEARKWLKRTEVEVNDGKQKIQSLINYDRLHRLIPSCPLVFIELSLGSKKKGRIVIKLNVNLPNISENIVNIVTGKNRSSLTGMSLNYYDDNSIGKEALPFSEFVTIPDNSDIYTCEKGDVLSIYSGGYLDSIYFQVDKDDFSHDKCMVRIIGSIVTGLDILQECYDNHINGVKITDCGLVLGEW